MPVDELATRCTILLSEVNREYKSKSKTGRLGPVKFMVLVVGELHRSDRRFAGKCGIAVQVSST